MAPSGKNYQYWLVIEVVVFIATILGNMVFLFFRAFVKQAMIFAMPGLMTSCNTDFLESQQLMVGMFVTFFVPMCYLYFISIYCQDVETLKSDTLVEVISNLAPMAVFQTVSMLFLMFIPIRTPMITRYQSVSDAWSKYLPFVHLGTTVCSFVLIPIAVIAYTFSQKSNIHKSAFEGGVWIYCITSFFVLLLWFPTQILGVLLCGIYVYREKAKARAQRDEVKATTWKELYGSNPDEKISPDENADLCKNHKYRSEIDKRINTTFNQRINAFIKDYVALEEKELEWSRRKRTILVPAKKQEKPAN